MTNTTNTTTIAFHGGAGTVTGSNFLLEDQASGTKMLVDCGFFQGSKVGDEENREPFPYNPAEIDFLFVTHAHIDHIGRIPRLVRDGFRGRIISTPITQEVAEVMLDDSLGILEKEARQDNKPIMYEKKDVEQTMRLWEGVDYHKTINVPGGYQVSLMDAGHILGSAMVRVERDGRVLVLTGDLGNSPAPILRDTEKVTDAHYIVMESVYGDRNHETRELRKHMLEDVIEETVKKGGALIVPAFSLERTQELLYEINDLAEHGRIPPCPIFLDSPLAIRVTRIYKKYQHYFNNKTQGVIEGGDDIFHFPNLEMTLKTEESKAIAKVSNPKVIIAGSGMSNGGRIIHHEKRHLPEPESTLLLIGYQAVGTMGRILEEGAKEVNILGDPVPVRARIAKIRGYSAHKDHDGLMDFVQNDAEAAEKIFIAMGEPGPGMFLAQRIRDFIGLEAVVTQRGQQETLNL